MKGTWKYNAKGVGRAGADGKIEKILYLRRDHEFIQYDGGADHPRSDLEWARYAGRLCTQLNKIDYDERHAPYNAIRLPPPEPQKGPNVMWNINATEIKEKTTKITISSGDLAQLIVDRVRSELGLAKDQGEIRVDIVPESYGSSLHEAYVTVVEKL